MNSAIESHSNRQQWLIAVIAIGVMYLVVGLVSGRFARTATSAQSQFGWRLSAFIVSGILFLVQIAYERYRLRNPTGRIAWHAALAVAFGAFLLALAANINNLAASSYRPRMLVALITWPLLTAVPAFIVAIVLAAVLNFRRAT